MYKIFTINALFLFLAVPLKVTGQYVMEPAGGRAGGLGNAAVTLQDSWSIYNNVGGTGQVDQISSMFAYENRLGMEGGIPSMKAALVLPYDWGVPGISFYRFGDELFSEQHISLSFGHKIGPGSIGIKGNLVQYHIEGAGIRRIIVTEFGGIMEIIPSLYFGGHIYNLNQAQLSPFNEEMVPVTMKTGMAYNPSEKLLLAMEIAKTMHYKTSLQTGLEYRVMQFHKNGLFLRTGITTYPLVNSFGIGFKHALLQIDYALNTRGVLGPGHQLSVDVPIRLYKNSGNHAQ